MTSLKPPTRSTAVSDDSLFPRRSRSPRPYHHSDGHTPLATKLCENDSVSLPASTLCSLGDTADQDTSHSEPGSGAELAAYKSLDDSGTEADDEGISFIKALPPSTVKPKKGLRVSGITGPDLDSTPFLTPSQLFDDGRHSNGYFESESGNNVKLDNNDIQKAQTKFINRRRAELLRRACELVLISSIGYIVVASASSTHGITRNVKVGLLCQLSIILGLLILYPIRLLLYPLLSNYRFKLGSILIPPAFDPAPLLYGPVVPVLVALLLPTLDPAVVLLNITLGLSTMPVQLIPSVGNYGGSFLLHWLLTTLPFMISKLQVQDATCKLATSHVQEQPVVSAVFQEVMMLAFPLHQALLPFLYYLTTTSLLFSEAQLLSVSLVNILLLCETPQSKILMALLWIGGVGLFALCTRIIRWNVTLERIPGWRFRQERRVPGSRKSLYSSLLEVLNFPAQRDISSDAEDATHSGRAALTISLKSIRNGLFPTPENVHLNPLRSRRTSLGPGANTKVTSNGDSWTNRDNSASLRRVQTAPASAQRDAPISFTRFSHRKRTLSSNSRKYLFMTHDQVEFRKWSYAAYTYAVTVLLILIPIRRIVSIEALSGKEPFGWAVGYLFGGLSVVRSFRSTYGLEGWIPCPPEAKQSTSIDARTARRIERVRLQYGKANTRLCLFAYWATTVGMGIAIVLRLTSLAEVDTRRKVFHGMMVLMLLPTTYIDPCFLSLGLILVLAVFLLLDLFRAAQLRPVSRPLARFLTPYVDGRDLRGPVIVSPIFLLIGCAIPLWLSLAGIKRTPDGWDLETRDVSMVAGVVCVGMGDAAASLVGRRYGRRKWPWAGGKSVEGSAAFALAVTIGLVSGKAWLRMGGWEDSAFGASDDWLLVTMKAVGAAMGASFTEAVLTGANDNVVVPVVLWLLVRALVI